MQCFLTGLSLRYGPLSWAWHGCGEHTWSNVFQAMARKKGQQQPTLWSPLFALIIMIISVICVLEAILMCVWVHVMCWLMRVSSLNSRFRMGMKTFPPAVVSSISCPHWRWNVAVYWGCRETENVQTYPSAMLWLKLWLVFLQRFMTSVSVASPPCFWGLSPLWRHGGADEKLIYD